MLYGTAQVNGRGRDPPSTEDRFLIRKITDDCDLFAVFDGHNGAGVVKLTLEIFPKRIQDCLAAAGPDALRNPAVLEAALKEAFIQHDKELARNAGRLRDSGSTASVALVTPTHIAMAYIGDSPAFLLNPTSGLIAREIGKHEPTLAAEAARIQAAGGTVEIDEDGTPRVDGSLMVSRAFGDFSLKWPEGTEPPFETANWSKMKVTALPDVAVWPRPENGVLAIMSDGLVETPAGTHKPTARVARDIHLALLEKKYNLPFTAETVLRKHVMGFVGSSRTGYDGDDLTLVLVDVGLRESRAETVKQDGGAAAVAAAAAAAARPKSRKVRIGRRNRTGKRAVITKIYVGGSGPGGGPGPGPANPKIASPPASLNQPPKTV
jgi:serine/threonine protein phosphatase PrpC